MRNSKFIKCMKACFDTEDGRKALACLKESYVETSALGNDPYQTYYKLGQKELIQLLVKSLDNPEELDQVDVAELYNPNSI